LTAFVEFSSSPSWSRYLRRLIASEISSFSQYYDQVIHWKPLPDDTGEVFRCVKCRTKRVIRDGEDFPDLCGEKGERTAVLLNGNLNYHFDIQQLFTELRGKLSRTSRLIVVAYNPYLAWVYRLAAWAGIRKAALPTTFVTRPDLDNIAILAGYEIIRTRMVAYFPWKLIGLGSLINWIMPVIPILRWSGLAAVITLRPVISDESLRPSLSVIIPARNEKGNIEAAVTRMPVLGAEPEIIFVEGHSNDGTWEEIERVVAKYGDQRRLKAFRQTGKGKGDAVRLGFSHASGELLTILDADLTMPPELLERFYDAYRRGLADFINGTRLVYPMEGSAMRFLNHLGNVFFAKSLSLVLGIRLGDSLCGTKLMARHDYARMVAWRRDFGDFDPFGDFELLFPAAVLGLGVLDVPIRYRARTYGSTSISRFRHGWMLLSMTLIGFFRISTGRKAWD
jgi:glycosyl transferase family 2